MDKALFAKATKNIGDIITLSIEHTDDHRALVVYDTKYELTNILTEAYRSLLPHAQFVDFDSVSKEEIIALFDGMHPGDLVVLIQTSNFLLDAFRIRLHLFKHKLKVIEHMHLYRNTKDTWDVYLNALEYDTNWYRDIGPRLKNILGKIDKLRIISEKNELVTTGGVEDPKLNIGDYNGMENIGGTFPIGEVFTEAKNFTQMNGSVLIYAFAGSDFNVNMHEPFRIDIENGRVVSWANNTPQAFIDIVTLIKQSERPIIREIGFGLNRAITREKYLNDITAFERILGMHLSLGEKHSVYKKDTIITHKARFHVDLFPLVDSVYADDHLIFKDGKYLP